MNVTVTNNSSRIIGVVRGEWILHLDRNEWTDFQCDEEEDFEIRTLPYPTIAYYRYQSAEALDVEVEDKPKVSAGAHPTI
ncbi:MAG TPA: hypothetical protein VJS44_08495 [Pyrinomonadaceae bacterium]|nr:hypothetical protein [Pyrinomonadaceae bacterium]